MGRGGFRVHVGDDACTWCLIDVFGVDTPEAAIAAAAALPWSVDRWGQLVPGRGAVGVVAGAPAWWVWDCPDRWPGVAFVGELSVSDFCSDWEDVLEGALVDFAFGADAVADAAAAL